MPVWKYRSIEEMPDAWTVRRDLPLGRRIRAVLGVIRIAGPLGIPRGVKKFHSIEELFADRRRYESARIARIRAKNAKPNE
jgi:hypothetical protein